MISILQPVLFEQGLKDWCRFGILVFFLFLQVLGSIEAFRRATYTTYVPLNVRFHCEPKFKLFPLFAFILLSATLTELNLTGDNICSTSGIFFFFLFFCFFLSLVYSFVYTTHTDEKPADPECWVGPS